MWNGVSRVIQRPSPNGAFSYSVLVSFPRKSSFADSPGRDETVWTGIEKVRAIIEMNLDYFPAGSSQVIVTEPLLKQVRDYPIGKARPPTVDSGPYHPR
jgi:hypothetical protein